MTMAKCGCLASIIFIMLISFVAIINYTIHFDLMIVLDEKSCDGDPNS